MTTTSTTQSASCAGTGTTATLANGEQTHYPCPECGKPLKVPKRREEDGSFVVRKHTPRPEDAPALWPFGPNDTVDDDEEIEDEA